DLVETDRDLLLAEPEEPADADHHGFDAAFSAEDEVTNVADLLVGVIVDGLADILVRQDLVIALLHQIDAIRSAIFRNRGARHRIDAFSGTVSIRFTGERLICRSGRRRLLNESILSR